LPWQSTKYIYLAQLFSALHTCKKKIFWQRSQRPWISWGSQKNPIIFPDEKVQEGPVSMTQDRPLFAAMPLTILLVKVLAEYKVTVGGRLAEPPRLGED
jgi:hypothetical protein